MVQTLTRHSLDFGDDDHRPQPLRITGLGFAIAANLALVLWLSIPGERVLPPPEPPAAPVFRWIEVEPVKPVEVQPVPPMPKPPQTLQLEKHPVIQQIVEVEQTSIPLPVPPVTPAVSGPSLDSTSFTIAEPPTAVSYRYAPPPPFPGAELRHGHHGTVLLQVVVGSDGRPREVEVLQSSGYSALDRRALEYVQQRWRFNPAIRDGHAVSAVVEIPIEFKIPGRG